MVHEIKKESRILNRNVDERFIEPFVAGSIPAAATSLFALTCIRFGGPLPQAIRNWIQYPHPHNLR